MASKLAGVVVRGGDGVLKVDRVPSTAACSLLTLGILFSSPQAGLLMRLARPARQFDGFACQRRGWPSGLHARRCLVGLAERRLNE